MERKRFKKDIKWLEYFMGLFPNSNLDFFFEFDFQIRTQIENILNRKFNWNNKIWLFIAPIDDQLDYYQAQDGTHYAWLKCELTYNYSRIPVEIRWFADDGEKIETSDSPIGRKITFEVQEIKLIKDWINKYPLVGDEVQYYPMDYSKNIKIFNIFKKSYPHEGSLEIYVKNDNKNEEIIKKIYDLIDNYNKESEQKNDRGFIHAIKFEDYSDGKLSLYYDSGSASDDYFRDIFSQLGNDVDFYSCIEKIIIDSLE